KSDEVTPSHCHPRARDKELYQVKRAMSALGHERTCAMQNGMSALLPKATEIADIVGRQRAEHLLLCPVCLNVSLLRYGKGIIHIDAEVTDSALYLRMT